MAYTDKDYQARVTARFPGVVSSFVSYGEYLARVTKHGFPQLTGQDAQDMIECLRTLAPAGSPVLGPQLDEVSRRFQAEIQQDGVAEDIPRLREIVDRYDPLFRAFFSPST